MAISDGVKVACRKCGRLVLSTELVLDNIYKMMVCQLCVKERKLAEERERQAAKQSAEQKPVAEGQKNKPAGWDSDDEFLERAAKEKKNDQAKVEKLDDDKVRYTCPKCKYQFTYHIPRKHPANCPFCSAPIYRFRI